MDYGGLAALLISAGTLVSTAWALRQKASTSYVSQLEHRIQVLEREVKDCEGERDRLQRENVALMRRILSQADGKDGSG